MDQLTLKEVLGFTVVAAVITTMGTLVGLVLKEWLFARSFEDWKSRRSLDQVYRKYRDPIVLAALELCNRLIQICDSYPPDYLEPELLQLPPGHRSTNMTLADPYFRRQRLLSSVYRLCSLLGWIELYRQDIVFLEAHETRASKLDKAIYAIRSDLADGQLNAAPEWENWQDAMLFRDEQRAVGESMIVTVGTNRVVMGYAQFSDVFQPKGKSGPSYWIEVASKFVLDPREKKDFRLVRMKRLIVHLVDLIELLGPSRLREEHLQARRRYQDVAT